MTRAPTPALASVVVLNTCTVTAAADQDARAAIRRVQRQNPEAQIVVTGCYAQRAPAEIAALPGVSLVIGNSHKHQLAEIVAASRAQIVKPASGESPQGFGWRSASRAANDPAPLQPASALEVPGFVPLAALSAAQSRAPEAGSPIFVSDIFAHTELLAAPVFDAANERTRPNLKVQDGCDNRCSFCVIPSVRGQSRALEMNQVIANVNTLVDSGYREVVISGINLGRWGRDLVGFRLPPSSFRTSPAHSEDAWRKPGAENRKPTLEDLIRAILSETSLEKLRISSVEPMDWSDQLIALVASSPRIAKHAHVPMQSGSDTVLRRMHRKYRPWHYREKIEKIRGAMPAAAIGADVMVGFPGETDAEFESTRRLIEELPFSYLHVFTYSARPGTPAAAMSNQVPVHAARERNRVLRQLAAEKKLRFMRGFKAKTVEVITLNVVGHDGSGEFTEALTDNYLKLRLRGRHAPNRWMRARVEDIADGALVGDSVGG
jgi:threonylcarbamoyladenosine tRNA methylthiotransferase MtaB